MTECNHCGACCRVIPMLQAGMAREQIQTLRTKGVREAQGFFLLNHDCQHLKKSVIWGSGESGTCSITSPRSFEWLCDIHATKPMSCKRWTGQRRIRNTLYYIPPRCVYNRGEVE